MAYVTVRGAAGRRIHELTPQVCIGRGSSSDILLDDLRASKRHCEIRERTDRFILSDLNSTNGTFVAGQRVDGEVSLQDGDEIRIGDTTLVFTRQMPPGVDSGRVGGKELPESSILGRDAAAPLEREGLQLAEKAMRKIPKGTVVVPLERFSLRSAESSTEGKEDGTPGTNRVEKESYLRSLYRLLREANQCDTEDDLFAVATRIIAEALPGARVRVLFEADSGVADEAAKDENPRKTVTLTAWTDPSRRGGRPTRVLGEELVDACGILLRHARERSVALMSPDVESDVRVRENSRRMRRAAEQSGGGKEKEEEVAEDRECVSLLIAPLLTGRISLGYLVAERSYRKKITARTARNIPFDQANLEFLAAAAFPLASMLERVRGRQRVLEENQRLRESIATGFEIVGKSAPLKAALTIIERVAPLASPVLILGESGTGKELFARAVHAMSPRKDGPFEAINCAALPDNLVESELFGHAKGAFTGAVRDRAGYFEMASGGTLFLDEIGDLPLITQAKLLRVLEESKVVRVGESRLRDIDVRIVAATNRDLANDVEEGRFRRDLYYRLRVMDVTLPALRERLKDLPLLCKHLLRPFGNFALHPEVFSVFKSYPWPGNIRELRNTLERMAVLARPAGTRNTRSGVIQLAVDDIPLDIRRAVGEVAATASEGPATLATRRRKTAIWDDELKEEVDSGTFLIGPGEMVALEDLQVKYANWVLSRVKGNKSKAARILGIQRSTLYSWTEWRDQKGEAARVKGSPEEGGADGEVDG